MTDYDLAVRAARELTMEDTFRLMQYLTTRFNDGVYPATDAQIDRVNQAAAYLDEAQMVAEPVPPIPGADAELVRWTDEGREALRWATEVLKDVQGMDMFDANDMWEIADVKRARQILDLHDLIGGEDDVAEGLDEALAKIKEQQDQSN